MTGVAVLGSTGSIGRQALEVISALPERFSLLALASGRGGDAIAEQLSAWPSARWWCADTRQRQLAPDRWAADGLTELATLDGVELVVVATTGMAALPAVLATLRSGRRVALANKETLITGGHLVTALLDELGGDPLERLRPIDSEHSAIWQCLIGESLESVAGLVLTASGGPFRGRDPGTLSEVTAEDALAHPTWRMGPKITIDSATLVNKAFEIIEAKWLYRLAYSKIDAGFIRRASCTRSSSSRTARTRHSSGSPTCASRSSTPSPFPSAFRHRRDDRCRRSGEASTSSRSRPGPTPHMTPCVVPQTPAAIAGRS